MEGLLARLQHAPLGKKELFDLLMSIDIHTLDTAHVTVPKEQVIYSDDATLVETIVIHPMTGSKDAEPKEAVAEPKEAVAEPKVAEPKDVEPKETIEQIIFYPEVGSDLPIILSGSTSLADIPSMNATLPVPEPVPEPVSEPEPMPTSSNIMESLFNLKRATTEEKTGPLFTCQACQRVFKRQHLLSQHHEISLACSQWLARHAVTQATPSGNKGIHQLVHDCLNRASRGEEDGKQECVYCKAPFTTKESLRAHFQASASCNRLALDAFKAMILAL
jgi:hypothetical protein